MKSDPTRILSGACSVLIPIQAVLFGLYSDLSPILFQTTNTSESRSCVADTSPSV